MRSPDNRSSTLDLGRATDADWDEIITTDARAFAMRNPISDDERADLRGKVSDDDVVLVVVVVAVCQTTGLGYGWLDAGTLGTANKVRSWLSIPTVLGLGTGQVGVLLGLGDHTTAILAITRPIAAARKGGRAGRSGFDGRRPRRGAERRAARLRCAR